MKISSSLKLIVLMCIFAFNGYAQTQRIDTTLKLGKSGYQVRCSNKDAEKNSINIRPVGFDKEARESIMNIKGRIIELSIEDLNNDGYPELVIYCRSGVHGDFVDAYTVISLSNKAFMAVGLPDVLLDAKTRDGYRGHDGYTLLEGRLMRKFPIYKASDTDSASGGNRIITYVLSGSENTGYKFVVERSVDIK